MRLPGSTDRTINDLVPEVVNALQGRTDVSTLVPLYMKRTLQDVTDNYPFEELRTTGPTVSLTAKQSTYPASLFLNPSDDYTIHSSFALYVDFPRNTVVSPVTYKTPAAIEMMIAPATVGIPAKWTRYGTSIFMGPTPNQNYSVFFRYQKRYQFLDDNLLATPVLISDSWEEIVIYSCAERIAIVKRWNDQQQYLHGVLYGDPEFQSSEGKRGRPGLLSAKLFQQEKDEQLSTRGLTPIVPCYCQH
jgi:hypothetical protein